VQVQFADLPYTLLPTYPIHPLPKIPAMSNLPSYPTPGRKFRFFQVEFAGLPYTLLPTYPILGRKFRFFQVEFASLPYTPTLSKPHYRQSTGLPYTHTA
jgi:hypothetical protein